MPSKDKAQIIYERLGEIFPNAHCELEHRNAFELTIAVMLSAQTTDAAVNKITKHLFEKYDSAKKFYEAEENDIYTIIKPLGLAKNKSHNIKLLAAMLIEKYNGEVPNDFNELIKLPGIGRKSANVILSCWFNVPAFPVDTHVERTAKRLGLASDNDSVLDVEKKICSLLKPEQYYDMHHRMIFFGRYLCKAQKPDCDNCKLVEYCIKNGLINSD